MRITSGIYSKRLANLGEKNTRNAVSDITHARIPKGGGRNGVISVCCY